MENRQKQAKKAQKRDKNELETPFISPQTDPFGSYTGRPMDGEVPMQDVDDL